MNIDKLTKNVNNLSASKDGKNKICYLVFKAAQAVVEIYRKDKVVDSFANYVSDTESVIGIKTYRLSNTTYQISFGTIEEAKAFIENERDEHPRSKKFNPIIWDNVERKGIHYKMV